MSDDYDDIIQNLKENLRLIEEKCSKFIYETDIPLQDLRERDRLKRQIAQLEELQTQKEIIDERGFKNIYDNPNDRSIIISEKEDILESVQIYLDYGDFISAKNILLGYLPYDELPIDIKLRVIIIEQKYGLIQEAREHMNIVISNNNWKDMPGQLQAQFNLINLKILCQEHNFNDLLSIYKDVDKSLAQNGQENFRCQVYWRAGLAYAVQRKLSDSKFCFEQALKLTQENKEKHAEITVRVMFAIAHIFRGIDCQIDSPFDFIVGVQTTYLQAPANIQLWQANRLKSSVQSLFAEAASYLAKRDDRGWTRLITANILTQMAKSHPNAEGYSDLLALIPKGELQKLIRLAMYCDENHRNEFQKKISHSLSMYLRDCQEVIYQLRKPTAENWKNFRNIFDSLDRKFA